MQISGGVFCNLAKNLMLKQEQERAQYELEMERQKIELEFKNKIKACEMKFTIETAEKEAELLERYGSEAASSHSLEDKSTNPQISGKEKIDRWFAGLDAKPLRRLEKVFRCYIVCETKEDYKEGRLMVWANYISPCSSIDELYFKGTCDVISVTMATHKVHKSVL